MPAGRPPTYDSPEILQQAIDLYFATCKAEKTNPSITILCYSLGFESRQSFYDYEDRAEFSYTVKRARLLIEGHYENGLNSNACTGSIFALKNMGWKDKVETGFTDNLGNDIAPVIYIPENGRNKNNQTAAGIPGESTELPG